jgi:hypothetical protein
MEYGMSQAQVWWRPGGRSPFSLDPRKARWPQIVAAIVQSVIIFGGPALALIAISHYPVLIEDRTLYVGGLGSILFWFLASFALFPDKSLPRGMPIMARLLFRAGFGLCFTGLLLGAALFANGYGSALVSRDVPVVAKHPTLHRDPARRIYYIAVRAWPNSRRVVELNAPRAVYDRLSVPITEIDAPQEMLDAMPDAASVRLTLGRGRFGWEWLKRTELKAANGE